MEPTHSSPPPPTSVSSPNSLHHDERVRTMQPSPQSSSNNVEVGQDLTSRNEVYNTFHYVLYTVPEIEYGILRLRISRFVHFNHLPIEKI